GKLGLYAWIGIAVILANIQVLKTVELFALVATLGNIIYGTTFLATDILSEVYGKAEAKKAVFMGFFFMIGATAIMWICLQFIPHISDFAQSSLETIFANNTTPKLKIISDAHNNSFLNNIFNLNAIFINH
ncbi:unnamed protein product, partial [marine sediment metagenome]